MDTEIVTETPVRSLTAQDRHLADAFPRAGSHQCKQHVTRGALQLTCTRATGHQGPHVAHLNDGTAVAMWGAR